MQNTISILTPTYNRGYLLEELFDSLKSQDSFQFEWIIVDDGSNDNTYAVVKTFQTETKEFPIYYIQQKNKGKHIAINNGVHHATGNFIFIVDSDDVLPPDSVSTILTWTKDIGSLDYIAGVAGLRGNKKTKERVGDFPKKIQYNQFIEVRNNERRKYNLLGDKAEVYRKEILLRYPFKEFVGERFLSESTVWDEIACAGYKLRWYNRIIYYCDYLDDGLTKSGIKKEIDNFEGFIYFTTQRIKCYGWIEGLIAKGYFWHVSKFKGLTLKEAGRFLSVSPVSLFICHRLWKMKNLVFKYFR